VAGKQVYAFGPYCIDVALSRLERAGATIVLPPKAFDLLLLLASNHERVMSKSELIAALWPNTFVDDANLTQHVYILRKALGEQDDGQQYVQTVARRGYRLAAAVRNANPTTTPVPAVPAPPPRTSVGLDGERKDATVLNCAVADAAAAVEHVGVAGMHNFMRQLMTIATEVIEQYEGLITERHADGFIAVFGASVVHEDDGHRSILAATEIGRRVQRLTSSFDSEERIALRFGIHTGPVIVSRVADDSRVEHTAVGETMAVADTLQQSAPPGAILISPATHDVVSTDVRVDTASVAVAGGGRAYRVTSLLRETKTATRLARSRTPMVGRHDETALLGAVMRRALAGAGQALSIVGEPGMGKSRLVAEFTQRLDGFGSPAILEGRCVSYGSLIPYLPLIDLARACCGVEETEAVDAIRRAVIAASRAHGLPPESTDWLLRLLNAGDDADRPELASPEAVKARTFDVLRLLFLRAALRRPLVVVVEDVHWIDCTSEEFLTTLVERIGSARILLLATHRPGYRAPWMDRSYATHITLSALNAADSATLVESVFHEHSIEAAASNAILSRGEGNPFFLEELARTVLEHGAGADTIPGTVRGVIMARIDRLPSVAKQVLQTASVLGREVPLRLLRRVWRSPESFDAELDVLRRLEFVLERPGDEPSFVFKHAMTQDVAYDSLLARTRRELHVRAAQALEQLAVERGDDIASTLAYHYARTDVTHEAVKWMTRAAERAASVYANAEAMLHLNLAARRLQRWPEDPDRDRWIVKVALLQAHSLYFLGRFRESVDVLLPHDARLARLGDPALTAAYAFWLAHMYSRLGDQRRATENARRAIEISTAIGDTATLGKAHGLLALESYWSGQPAVGVVQGGQAVQLLEDRADQRWWLGMAHFYLALNHLLAGDFDDALAESARADGVGRDIGDPRLQTYAAYIVGWTEALRGRHDVAVAACRRGLEQAPDRVSRAYASLFLGYALLERGEHRDALMVLGPVVVELAEFAIPQWLALAATLTGESLRVLGRTAEAEKAVARGLQIATKAGYTYAVGFSNVIAGRLALDRGALAEATAAFERALETFERGGAVFEAARSRLELARLGQVGPGVHDRLDAGANTRSGKL
jgi:DNA-binding winged helix-turn-helix (wHTH) protein/tetratricopeptide (TPR) repeat protein